MGGPGIDADVIVVRAGLAGLVAAAGVGGGGPFESRVRAAAEAGRLEFRFRHRVGALTTTVLVRKAWPNGWARR